ncbi:MAG: DNA internalization-related competence protein ComEC/Rec2 [Vicinamibacterales bacterium]
MARPMAAIGLAAALVAFRAGRAWGVVACGLAGVWAASAGAGAAGGLAAAGLIEALADAGLPPDALSARGADGVARRSRVARDAASSSDRVEFLLRVERLRARACGCVSRVDGMALVTVAGDAAASIGPTLAGEAPRACGGDDSPSRRETGQEVLGAAGPGAAARLVASVKSAWLVEAMADGSWAAEAASALRARTRDALARAAGEGSDAAGVATAVLIGDRAGLTPGLEERLQRAGTFHVMAISGGNIAVWTLLTLGLAGRLTRHRTLGLGAAALTLGTYAWVVGGGASVLRATGMALVGIACQAADLRGAAINVVALTAAALVAADPRLVFDVGFWLTSAATAGIVVGLPPGPGEGWRRWTRALVVTSVWAEAALLPIGAAVFQLVAPAGVLLSALAIPAMAVVQTAALAAVAVDAVWPWGTAWLGGVLRVATALVTESARLVDAWPWLSWRVPPPEPAAVGVYYALLGAWVWTRRPAADTAWARTVRRATALLTPAAAVWIAVAPLSLVPRAPDELRLTVFDVGQGDAMLVEFPNGRTMLVDAGAATSDGRDVGGRVVGAAMRALGVRRLDYLVVTHADADHLGGAATIVREFSPAEVWVGVAVADHPPSAALRAVADTRRAGWREVRAGERLRVGDTAVEVRYPPPPDWQRIAPRNDDSVVLVVRWREVQLVLTGDIGAEPERALAPTLAADPSARLTVLKVAHHGSAGSTSEAWVQAVRPQVAVVSAGASNPFGHPAAAVLERLERLGASVWRTDREGAVTVRTDGRTLEVAGHAGRRLRIGDGPRGEPALPVPGGQPR